MHAVVLCETRDASFLWSRVSPEGARQASQSANAWGARLTCLVQPHMRQGFRLTQCIIIIIIPMGRPSFRFGW